MSRKQSLDCTVSVGLIFAAYAAGAPSMQTAAHAARAATHSARRQVPEFAAARIRSSFSARSASSRHSPQALEPSELDFSVAA